MLSTCKHIFCRQCLSDHFTKSAPESTVLACPTCQVESPLPKNGVDGFVDYSKGGVDEEEVKGADGRDGDIPSETEVQEEVQQCLCCKYKTSANVQAVNICEDCGHCPMCNNCTEIHGKYKATKDHVVTPLKSLKGEEDTRCEVHDQLFKHYCSTCSKPVCHVCIMIEHGDHEVLKIGETLRDLVREMTAITKQREAQLKDLRKIEKDLKEKQSTALGERATLVKAIEDQAEKFIEEAIRQKNALKAKVNAAYIMIDDVTATMETIPNIAQQLDESIIRANRMLSGRALHLNDLEKLTAIRESLENYGKLADEIDWKVHLKDYQQVQQRKPGFEPSAPVFSVGSIVYDEGISQMQAGAASKANPYSVAKQKAEPARLCESAATAQQRPWDDDRQPRGSKDGKFAFVVRSLGKSGHQNKNAMTRFASMSTQLKLIMASTPDWIRLYLILRQVTSDLPRHFMSRTICHLTPHIICVGLNYGS
jgi:flagellar biosynthesis/type III secretory pathway protein FliH